MWEIDILGFSTTFWAGTAVATPPLGAGAAGGAHAASHVAQAAVALVNRKRRLDSTVFDILPPSVENALM